MKLFSIINIPEVKSGELWFRPIGFRGSRMVLRLDGDLFMILVADQEWVSFGFRSVGLLESEYEIISKKDWMREMEELDSRF